MVLVFICFNENSGFKNSFRFSCGYKLSEVCFSPSAFKVALCPEIFMFQKHVLRCLLFQQHWIPSTYQHYFSEWLESWRDWVQSSHMPWPMSEVPTLWDPRHPIADIQCSNCEIRHILTSLGWCQCLLCASPHWGNTMQKPVKCHPEHWALGNTRLDLKLLIPTVYLTLCTVAI